ncbi:DUF2380 domain-containing protein [Mesorhizobium yinganensis]|uniref:DUF2380 domain-containing protein n=1 Tax=Mesorhizobium yinganensis TaxID=3157707 RepID=UPI0032B7B040
MDVARSRVLGPLAGTLLLLSPPLTAAAHAQQAGSGPPVRIAVFDFELEDKSAGAGIIAQDEHDTKYLAEATQKARDMLSAAGYTIVDTKGADLDAAKKFGIRNCGGCEAPAALKLGGDQAMLGVVTRVNRTEYTLFIRVLDARSGEQVSNNFTNLRMGANYAWPRGVKWLMDKQVLAAK